MFVLRTLIESSRSSKQPLYSCYVDFKKAYDTIPRDLLWLKLQRIGVHGEFLHAMQALYASVPMGTCTCYILCNHVSDYSTGSM